MPSSETDPVAPAATPPPDASSEIPSGRPASRAEHTIRDIARLAGVSRSTVSLALNDSPKINKLTKAKVLEVIAGVGYRPNATARNLVRRNSNTILVVLPPINHVFADSYFSESLSGILDDAAPRHFHLMVELATDEFKQANDALKLYRQGTIDGCLCVGGMTTDVYIEELHAAGCPVVLVNSALGDVPNVVANNLQAAFRAVKHLHSLGHRRIAHIQGSDLVTSALDRTAGYRKAVEELGLDADPKLTAQGYFGKRSGQAAMKKLLDVEPRPTAVFTTNDMMAIGAIGAIREAGLRVPEDVAVFGGDDVQLGQYVEPRLSTIGQSMYSIGQAAADHLFAHLEGRRIYNPTVTVGLRLIIRESCGSGVERRGEEASAEAPAA